jgi:hypothetical protein
MDKKFYTEYYYGLVKDEFPGDSFLNQFVAYAATAEGNRNLKVIISHTDLDGVTSAVNLVEAVKMIGDSDIIVFLERTSRSEFTSKIAETFVQENSEEFEHYNTVEFMIADRMFIDLNRDFSYPENALFSWYDHHAGNVISEEVIREKLGSKLIEYFVATDIKHCGATITSEAMEKRIYKSCGEENVIDYRNAHHVFSYNVNLWDTFRWKNDPETTLEEKELGKKFGSIDKMMESEKHLFQKLMFKLINYETLDHNMVYDWIDNLDKEYKDLVEAEYNIASKRATRYNEKIVILPAEWKFASNIKELWVNDHPETDIVITCHKSGGTVYTSVPYEIPSYEIARFIGESYGLNGGGHKNAAGFGCLDLAVSQYLSEDEMKYVVEDRIIRALDEFFKK